MPIKDRDDAVEVEDRTRRIFAAAPRERAAAIRSLFVEVLDFDAAAGRVDLAGARGNVELPDSGERIAQLDGVHVVYVALETPGTDRVRKAEAAAAAKAIADQLGDDLLLVFTNPSVSQLHLIHPSFEGTQPTLRRMVVERYVPRRTAVQQVSNIYWNRKDTGSIRTALKDAFDVEPVTKAFFAEYKTIFEAAEENVSGFGDDKAEREAKRLFVQTLFNRLMFVYFLQRKGWMSFQGDKDYLNALWLDYGSNAGDSNFYRDRLRHLFFFGLNNSLSMDLNFEGRVMELIFGKVPFLNGGLFEETELDKRADVTVPDGAIERVLRDLFDRFNFTVMESTPFDIEVAVDPEMLGKVFEELVNRRRDSGSYYTPRPVVSFMCREALKGYLGGQDSGLSPEAIAKFVDDHDTSDIPLPAAGKVGGALSGVTVVDPACGSGAYLLGMMQELVELQSALYNVGVDDRSLYDLKLHIIQNNLYGVDNAEFAVNIAMLRMWLSLAIEFEGDSPPPLPNLDFKVVLGDSLLGPDPSAGVEVQIELGRDVEQIKRLGERKAEYMRTSAGEKKEKLRGEIHALEEQVKRALGDAAVSDEAVDWRLQFAEVFANGGFDIAVANPPYIQLQKDEGKLGRLYGNVGYATFVRSGDVYQLFYERGCQVLRPDRGLLAYITSNSWLKAEYGKRQRRFFSERHTPLRLLELGKDIFESAIVDSSVLILRKGGGGETFPAVDMDTLPTSDFPPQESLWGEVQLDGEAPWSILTPVEQRVMEKMRAGGVPLGEWEVKINRGIITGYNKAFIIDETTRKEMLAEDPSSSEIFKPIIQGKDLQRYWPKWTGRWLIYNHAQVDENNYPTVREHLLPHKQALLKRRGGANPRTREVPYEWWQLQVDYYSSGAYQDFAKEKLFWMDMSPQGKFAYCDTEMYCNDKAFIMTGGPLKYLCAVLNSSLITWTMRKLALTTGMGLIQWKKFTVRRLPIPRLSTAKQDPFIRLVDEILEAKATNPDADTSRQETEIDELVYELYGLSEQESTAIERRLGLVHDSDEAEDAVLVRAMEEGLSSGRVSKGAVRETLRSP